MTRFLLSSVAAVILLAAPVAASAATTAPAPAAAKPMKAKPVMKASAKHGKMMAKPVRRDPGSAAVDALNDKSLAAAKAGQ